ncbi:MAG: CsgG/HfaB family protein [Candidatus Manganitrophaceae bacterium]
MKQPYLKQPLGLFLLTILVLTAGRIDPAHAQDSELERLYQEGQYAEAVKTVGKKDPSNPSEALYLGLSHLRLGNQKEAISAWQQYVRLEPGGEGNREISKYLTLLLQEEAKRTAREVLQQEKQLSGNGKIDPRAIAVTPFQNFGQQSFGPLTKGLVAMIITDLSKVKALKVVERIQLRALLDELKLAQSGLVDTKNAPRIGKLLGAGKITTGSFLDIEQEQIRLNASVTQTESGDLISSPQAGGDLPSFYKMQKELVFKILCGIGHCPEGLDRRTKEAVETIHTKNFKAFRFYSQGLESLDQGKYREASRFFFMAVGQDPEFELARKALLETPLFPLDLAAMISGAEAVGRGQMAIPFTNTLYAAPRIPEKIVGQQMISPILGILTPPAPLTTVPVRIEINFPQQP